MRHERQRAEGQVLKGRAEDRAEQRHAERERRAPLGHKVDPRRRVVVDAVERREFVGAPNPLEVGWRPQHDHPPREAEEEVEGFDRVLLEAQVGLMDAHLVHEAVGVEEGNALTPQHRGQVDDARDDHDGAGAHVYHGEVALDGAQV